jgi:hypothetical protein
MLKRVSVRIEEAGISEALLGIYWRSILVVDDPKE